MDWLCECVFEIGADVIIGYGCVLLKNEQMKMMGADVRDARVNK